MTVPTATPNNGLQVRNLVKHFGGVRAVQGVSFEVVPGECVALIGPNGAGKSTTFACIAGQHAVTSGEVLWAGQNMGHLAPARRLHAGVARTFQVAQTFEALTVLQNVLLAQRALKSLSAFQVLERVEQADSGVAMALLMRLGLREEAHRPVLGLPYGLKKRLELALALAGISADNSNSTGLASDRAPIHPLKPKLLLLDEPAAGLAAPERAALMQTVKHQAAQGMAVLYTEHNMDAVFGVADRVLVLIDGKIAAQGTPAAIAQDSTVQRRYLGLNFHA